MKVCIFTQRTRRCFPRSGEKTNASAKRKRENSEKVNRITIKREFELFRKSCMVVDVYFHQESVKANDILDQEEVGLFRFLNR